MYSHFYGRLEEYPPPLLQKSGKGLLALIMVHSSGGSGMAHGTIKRTCKDAYLFLQWYFSAPFFCMSCFQRKGARSQYCIKNIYHRIILIIRTTSTTAESSKELFCF